MLNNCIVPFTQHMSFQPILDFLQLFGRFFQVSFPLLSRNHPLGLVILLDSGRRLDGNEQTDSCTSVKADP